MAQGFYPNAQTVIDAALRAIAVADPEGAVSPSTTERTNALEALNFLVTSWQADGLQVWCQKQASTSLTASQNSYTCGPAGNIVVARPNIITQAWLREASGSAPVDIPLEIIDRSRYNLLSSKASEGTPSQLFYDPLYDMPGGNSGANAYGKLYLFSTPDTNAATNYNLYVVYTRPIQDFNATTDYLDFPQEWFNAIKWNLAYQIAFEYGVPVEILDRVKKIAEEEKERVLGWDTAKESVYFQVDTRYR